MDRTLRIMILLDMGLFVFCLLYGVSWFSFLSFELRWVLFGVLGVSGVLVIVYFWFFGKVSIRLLGKEWVLPQGCFLCLVEGRHLCESCRYGELANGLMVEKVLKG